MEGARPTLGTRSGSPGSTTTQLGHPDGAGAPSRCRSEGLLLPSSFRPACCDWKRPQVGEGSGRSAGGALDPGSGTGGCRAGLELCEATARTSPDAHPTPRHQRDLPQVLGVKPSPWQSTGGLDTVIPQPGPAMSPGAGRELVSVSDSASASGIGSSSYSRKPSTWLLAQPEPSLCVPRPPYWSQLALTLRPHQLRALWIRYPCDPTWHPRGRAGRTAGAPTQPCGGGAGADAGLGSACSDPSIRVGCRTSLGLHWPGWQSQLVGSPVRDDALC